jgi:hypothetical protein
VNMQLSPQLLQSFHAKSVCKHQFCISTSWKIEMHTVVHCTSTPVEI